MSNHLVITALGSDRPGIVEELAKNISEYECNIEDSRMTVLGGEFALMLIVSGHWNTIAKLQAHMPSLEQTLGMTIITKNTEARQQTKKTLPYIAEIIAIDHQGIVKNLANFFSARDINIEEMSTNCYAAAHTGTSMFSVHMEIGIPSSQSISDLREAFMEFCDSLNLDAVLEPMKS